MTEPRYEDIQTVQEAINKAVATEKVVRFLSTKSNKVLKSEIDNPHGCAIRKPDKESNDVAVIPPNITDFSFEEVDTTVATWTPSVSKA